MVYLEHATPGYFQTIGIPLLAGRTFTKHDRRGAQAVVIVAETTAKLYWPNEDPLGKGFYWGTQDLETGKWDPRYPRPPPIAEDRRGYWGCEDQRPGQSRSPTGLSTGPSNLEISKQPSGSHRLRSTEIGPRHPRGDSGVGQERARDWADHHHGSALR